MGASQNGNMAELLQEPSLMGALEGAAITVLRRVVQFPSGTIDPFGTSSAAAGTFPAGTTLVNGTTSTTGGCGTSLTRIRHPSNFYCNPSSIDGITITNSSQGGGGIFVHAWGHNLQIANDRVVNNAGNATGGISVGQASSGRIHPGRRSHADPGFVARPAPPHPASCW